MTTLAQNETERIFSRQNDRLWDLIQRDWAGESPRRWKALACIHLRLHCQWPLESIARAFGHARGHILRLINQGLDDLQAAYAQGCNALEPPDDLAPLAGLLNPAGSELDRRIACCRQELDIWQRLRERQVDRLLWGAAAAARRIIDGSLRQRVAGFLRHAGPHRSTKIALALGTPASRIRNVLWHCPEFVSDELGVWSLHPFAGQELLGVDTELFPVDDSQEPTAAPQQEVP
jgi:hypothetical protein